MFTLAQVALTLPLVQPVVRPTLFTSKLGGKVALPYSATRGSGPVVRAIRPRAAWVRGMLYWARAASL